MSQSTTHGNTRNPHAWVPGWVARQNLSASELKVYLALATFANKSRQCWPKIEQISERSGVPVRSVQRATQGLDSKGLVMRRAGRGRGRSTLYVLLDQEPVKGVNSDVFSGDRGTEKTRQWGSSQKGTNAAPPMSGAPIEQTSKVKGKVKGYLGQEEQGNVIQFPVMEVVA